MSDQFFYTNDPDHKSSHTYPAGVKLEYPYFYIDQYPETSLFYYSNDDYYYISNDIRKLREISNSNISNEGIIQLGIFQANLYPYSIYEKIITLPLNSKIFLNKNKFTFERIEHNNKEHIDLKQSIHRLNEIFEKELQNTGNNPYHMYSGGVDSSIVFHFLKEKDVIAGSSIYTRTDTSDVSRGMDHFKGFKQNLVPLNTQEYLNILDNYSYFIPYICPGTIDDYIHCKNALDMNCSSIVNGHGSDEIMAAYLLSEKEEDLCDADFYLNRFSMFKLEFLELFFSKKMIYDVLNDTIENFNFKTLKDKISWITEFHQVPLQLSLMDNNSRLNQNIKRYLPFSTRDFFDLVNKLPEDLISNNNIAEYVLRKWASDFLPINLWAKEKKTFEVDFDTIVKEEPDKIKNIFHSKLDFINSFLNNDIDKIWYEYKKRPASEKINFLLWLGVLKDFFVK